MAKKKEIKSDGSKVGNLGKKVLDKLSSKSTEDKLKKFKETGRKVITTAVKVADPTGLTNAKDLYNAYKSGSTGQKVIETVASIPTIGKVGKIVRALDTATKGKRTGLSLTKMYRGTASALSEAKEFAPKKQAVKSSSKMPYTSKPKGSNKPVPLKKKK